MADNELEQLILIVTGASIRAEQMDRPLAYRTGRRIAKILGPESTWQSLVISDALYLNQARLQQLPVISIGGPGVNGLSALLYRQLPSVLTIDDALIIQMDATGEDPRCCLWGMDHDQTVQALNLFFKLQYLERFIRGITQIA